VRPYAIGIDLGGTNIKGGLVRRDGTVVLRQSIKTEVDGGVDHVVGRIAGLINTLMTESDVDRNAVASVCVGSPGPLDSKTGVIYDAPNLHWKDVPLIDRLEPLVSMPVFVENDANAAAFGEAWAGAARNLECTILLTLGTGIGGGVVLNGKVWRGVTDTAAELGHMVIDYNGRPCSCGNRGCIEAYASAPAVAARMKEAIEAGRESSLRDAILAGEDVDSKRIYDAAVAGDELSREIIEETGRLLGVAVANYVNIFNPNYVILHGGMVEAGEMLLAPLREELAGRSFEASRRHLKVLPSALKGDAGIVGAAGCAFARSKDSA
jgi:glucokinase